MPITKSAKKEMRKDARKTERNKGTRTRVKTFEKKIMDLSKTDAAEAEKLLPQAYKHIDTAAKKNIIHKKKAARKKSLLARMVASAKTKKKPAVTAKKGPAKAAAPKTEAKKEV